MTNSSDFVTGEIPSIDVEAERRRLRRWFWALGVLAVIGLASLVRWNYPIVQTSSGMKFQVTQAGHYLGTDGSWTQFDYITHTASEDGRIAEMRELLPIAAEL